MARSTPRRRAPKPRPWSRSRSATPPRAEQEPSTPSRTRVRLLAGLWFLLSLAGVAALVAARASWGPAPLADLGAVVVSTTYVWALAARTGGRPVVFALLSLAVGVAVVVADRDVLRNGAAVMTGTVAAILAVVVTVPAVRSRVAVREVLVSALVAAGGALAVDGFHPTIDFARFQYLTLAMALVGGLVVVHRLGAGLHGLGRRGLLIVVFGSLLLALTLLYGELLRRYGTPALVQAVEDAVHWLRDNAGASPRPIVAVLGVPALMWGVHMRARRRQGWWVCAFGVAATTPITHALLIPLLGWRESALALGYGILVGLVLGHLLIRIDLALTGGRAQRGRRGRRAEEAAALRPEPARIDPLL